MSEDLDTRRQAAAAIYAEAIGTLSVTRDGTLEITSRRQLKICEQAAERILAMQVDEESNATAMALRDRARTARSWIWGKQVTAGALAFVAVLAGVGSSVLGGLTDNLTVAIIGALTSSLMLAGIIVRYRRTHWRIRMDEIAPLIWKPGI